MAKVKVGVIDYGVGNLGSVANAVSAVGGEPRVSSNTTELGLCERLILPGVGAFQHGMKALIEAGLDQFIYDYVAKDKPLLGICLGMQMLVEHSMEFGETAGLGLLPGRITKLESAHGGQPIRLPNVGWLPVMPIAASDDDLVAQLFLGVDPTARFYFIHSFAAAADSPVSAAVSEYEGIRFASVIARKNIVGTQFHPEKSGPRGLQVLGNFISR